jgi:hypothetical protein
MDMLPDTRTILIESPLDFWIDILQYLSPRNLFQLSCVSKSMNHLVWTHLIPVSDTGLKFSPPYTAPNHAEVISKEALATIDNYLARVGPSLKRLDLQHFYPGSPVLEFLTKITSLSSLSLPCWKQWSSVIPSDLEMSSIPSPLAYLSHLTSLTEIAWHQPSARLAGGHEKIKEILCYFENLKALTIKSGNETILSQVQKQTKLEKLDYETRFPVDTLSQLTNLTDLKMSHGGGNFKKVFETSGLEHLTNLTKLDCQNWKTETTELLCLTNLKYLDFTFTGELPHEVSKILTKLTHLVIHEQDSLHEVAPANLELLTNLQELVLSFSGFHKGLVDQLCGLPEFRSLQLVRNLWDPDCFDLDLLSLVTNLRKLYVPLDSAGTYCLTSLTNLTILDLDLTEKFPHPVSFSFLQPLTKLKMLKCHPRGGKSDAPRLSNAVDLDCLSNLTALEIPFCGQTNDFLQKIVNLTQLQTLKLPLCSDLGHDGIEIIAKNFTKLENLSLYHPLFQLSYFSAHLELLATLPRIQELCLGGRDTLPWEQEFWKLHFKYHTEAQQNSS